MSQTGSQSSGSHFRASPLGPARRQTAAGSEQCDRCCTGVIRGVAAAMGHAFCCMNASRAQRVVVLWCWITAIILSSSLSLLYGAYGKYTINMAPTDQRPVQDHLSTFWCDEVVVDSNHDVQSYMVSTMPSVGNERQKYSTQLLASVSPTTHQVFGYYLLQQSSFDLDICVEGNSNTQVILFFIKGKRNLKKWKKNIWCQDCTINGGTWFFGTDNCVDSRSFKSYSALVGRSDEYYFALAQSEYIYMSPRKPVVMNVTLMRTTFDMSTAAIKSVCGYEKVCRLSYDFRSEDVLIVENPEEGNINFDVKVSCKPLTWIYAVLFCVVPFLVGSSATVAIAALCKKKEGDGGLLERGTGFTNPGYGAGGVDNNGHVATIS